MALSTEKTGFMTFPYRNITEASQLMGSIVAEKYSSANSTRLSWQNDAASVAALCSLRVVIGRPPWGRMSFTGWEVSSDNCNKPDSGLIADSLLVRSMYGSVTSVRRRGDLFRDRLQEHSFGRDDVTILARQSSIEQFGLISQVIYSELNFTRLVASKEQTD